MPPFLQSLFDSRGQHQGKHTENANGILAPLALLGLEQVLGQALHSW